MKKCNYHSLINDIECVTLKLIGVQIYFFIRIKIMNKSITTFVLLLSSLVMVAAMPFVNMNIVSKAMAQGYDDYYSDSYSQYPTEDKKYECRTSPFEGFFVVL